MKYLLIYFLLMTTLLASISIYDIQYTTEAGGGTYPSLYVGDNVTTGGIVTGTDYSNGRFFISSSAGGAWNGIYVYNNNYDVALGDSVIIDAEVYEYHGFTELSYVSSLQIVSSGNPLPPVTIVSTGEAGNELYESVCVRVEDVSVTQEPDGWDYWMVNDGTGNLIIDAGFFSMEDAEIPVLQNFPFASITGIIIYSWSEFHLSPRTINDLNFDADSYIISIPNLFINSPEIFSIPINLIFAGNEQSAESYQFELTYNDDIMQYSGYELAGTLSQNGTLDVNESTPGTLTAAYDGNFSYSLPEVLLKLNFSGLESGAGNLNFADFSLDGNTGEFFSLGILYLQMNGTAIGDTLTVIQKPLLNIPAIVCPGDLLPIECLADSGTTGWNAFLQNEENIIPLDITSSNYNSALGRWQLTALVPSPDIYELYDLVVEANEIETDITWNAVHLIPGLKDNYYFVQVTDAHLPNHLFYPDPEALIDTTEVNDFREVIRDINLIHPEFVVLTGDLVNEGEMEEFENRRVYTKAQQLLAEFDVPVYLVTGNHDVGGWDGSPPSQGTARRNWWNFFGWNWLQDPPDTDPYYTQNYSFNYGSVHYIGMESYINYDDYMFPIYGNDSFTAAQMDWLEADLQENQSSESKVLFYHYDFSDQINLVSLGLDMALYGHIHYNNGNINSHPYNLATDNTCDGDRAFRVIRVNNGDLIPTETLYSGWNGDNLKTTFTPHNIGAADSVYVLVESNFDQEFSDARIKFIMPLDAEQYRVENGTLLQIDQSGENAICYVEIVIPANGNVTVSMIAEQIVEAGNIEIPSSNYHLRNYPNPFNPVTIISFGRKLPKDAMLEIYDAKGCLIEKIDCPKGSEQISWDARSTASGIYFYKLMISNKESGKGKMMLLK